MHLARTRLAQHPDKGALRVAAHDRVIDDDQALPRDDVPQGIELQPDAQLPDRLRRLDEGPSDVGVLDQALGERDTRRLRIADSGIPPGLGNRDDEIRINGMLGRQGSTDGHACSMDTSTGDDGIRSSEVYVLEEAALGLSRGKPMRAQTTLVDRDHLARLDLAHERCADDVQRRRLGGDHPAAFESTQHQRSDPVSIASPIEGFVIHEHQGEGAGDLGKFRKGRLLDGPITVRGNETGEDLGVTRRRHASAERKLPGLLAADPKSITQVRRIRQVAVVSESQMTRGRGPEGWLGVLPDAGTGCRVARMADGEIAAQGIKTRLGEHLRDEPHVLVDEDLGAIAHGNPCGLLPAVLECIEAEVGQLRHVVTRSPDPEDSAGVLRPAFARVQVVGEQAIASRHCLSVRESPTVQPCG